MRPSTGKLLWQNSWGMLQSTCRTALVPVGEVVAGITIEEQPPRPMVKVFSTKIRETRWSIELTESLHCEVPGLGKPRAALLMFALVAGNALAVVRAALRKAHDVEREVELSGFYLADEVAADYRTLMKYLPAEQWLGWRRLPARELVRLLTAVARQVHVAGLTRTTRGPKKPPAQKRIYDKKHKHRSTARLLEEADNSC